MILFANISIIFCNITFEQVAMWKHFFFSFRKNNDVFKTFKNFLEHEIMG